MVECRSRGIVRARAREASTLIAEQNISIRQILAEDAEIYPDPKLILITEKPIPGILLQQFLDIPTVLRVTIS